jgi:hypothetical protein
LCYCRSFAGSIALFIPLDLLPYVTNHFPQSLFPSHQFDRDPKYRKFHSFDECFFAGWRHTTAFLCRSKTFHNANTTAIFLHSSRDNPKQYEMKWQNQEKKQQAVKFGGVEGQTAMLGSV